MSEATPELSPQQKAARKRWKGHTPGISKSFRLQPRTIAKIEDWAKALGTGINAALERLVTEAGAPPKP